MQAGKTGIIGLEADLKREYLAGTLAIPAHLTLINARGGDARHVNSRLDSTGNPVYSSYPYRESVWICSRNDAIGNIAVMLAAGGVFFTGTKWPDLLVAGIMASLALSGAWRIIRSARKELKAGRHHTESDNR